MIEARLVLGLITLAATVLILAFFTALSAPLAHGLAALCALTVTGTACCLNGPNARYKPKPSSLGKP